MHSVISSLNRYLSSPAHLLYLALYSRESREQTLTRPHLHPAASGNTLGGSFNETLSPDESLVTTFRAPSLIKNVTAQNGKYLKQYFDF